ncbi:MAG: peptidase [Gemmatimonadetes bacterium]|nr:peptidase [Gemmatimonadota bacterium]
MFSFISSRRVRLAALAVAVPGALAAQSKDLPLKYVGPPTRTEITAGDLMTRLYKFADDSMMGRAVGTEYNNKGTAYIESEVRKLGLVPAGDNGTYFQNLPLFLRAVDTTSTITVEGGPTLKLGTDFLATASGRPRQVSHMQVIYGGMLYDTTNVLTAEQAKGKIVVFTPFMPGSGFNQGALLASAGFKGFQKFMSDVTYWIAAGESIPPNTLRGLLNPTNVSFINVDVNAAVQVTSKTAEVLFGAPLAGLAKGALGKTVSSDIRFVDTPKQVGRNVVAILPGSDPKLKGEYVAIGAHNDHIGFNQRPADHDSVKAFMALVRPQGADNALTQATAEQVAQVKKTTDSLHVVHGGARPDSIYNGADDDGTGTVSVLEIAELLTKGKVKPKRSIIFVWHAGEERGLWGSQYFTDHPTVPRDSIVAQLNIDMVGRGRSGDATGEDKAGGLIYGGPGYLQLVGSRRLSTELGDLIETVNTEKKLGFKFDYRMDADGHPQNIYCRSDHYEYARYGIPIVFMTTGGHADYHQVTDEPQYIDYDHMAQVGTLIYESALKLAALDHRPLVDKPKPDPHGVCVQ